MGGGRCRVPLPPVQLGPRHPGLRYPLARGALRMPPPSQRGYVGQDSRPQGRCCTVLLRQTHSPGVPAVPSRGVGSEPRERWLAAVGDWSARSSAVRVPQLVRHRPMGEGCPDGPPIVAGGVPGVSRSGHIALGIFRGRMPMASICSTDATIGSPALELAACRFSNIVRRASRSAGITRTSATA